MGCCWCFEFSFSRKPKGMGSSSGSGSHTSQASLLSKEGEDDDCGSYNGYLTDIGSEGDCEFQSPTKRSEEILVYRMQHGLICREFPVKETHELIRSEDENGNKMVNEYVREYKIGAGSYGKVVLYRSQLDGKHYAIKAFHKSHLLKQRVAPSETAMSDVLREVLIMKMLSHPNIVNLVEVIDDPATDHFYMVLEYVKGKWVYEGAGPPGGIGEHTARKYLRDIVSGLMYLHAHDGAENIDFATNHGIELESISLNMEPSYVFNEQNPPAPPEEVIVLSDSEEENEPLISSEAIYKNNHMDNGGTTFPVSQHGIPGSFPEDPAAFSNVIGLFNAHDDDFGMHMWSLPSGSQGAPGFQLFGSDAVVTDALVDVQHGSINCPTSSNGFTLTAENAMGSAALVPESSVKHTNANDGLVDNPLAFSGNDPSLQIFLPTRPSEASAQADTRDLPDVSNGIRSEDWISLRLGGGSAGGHGEPAASNILSSGNQLQSKNGALDSLADTASLLLGMNDKKSGKMSRERSDSPFSFPRQRRSVRPRLYLSIDSDSE